VTLRGAGTLVLAIALLLIGWHTGWPELTALGAAALTLVVLALALAGPPPAATIDLDRASLRVVREEPATVPMTVRPNGRHRWMRVVEGQPRLPTRSLALPAKISGDRVDLKVPMDTSRRGEFPIGPYHVVHGDPWSMTRRSIAHASGGVVTVLPRTYPVARALLTHVSVDDTPLSSRRAGEQHFHALRDYVLGDEPRTVHWRSSAKVGHLVVRQQVAAATTGTAVVLDCDTSAYGSDEQFGSGWIADRFEAAVEVAASIVVAPAAPTEQVHLVRSTRGSTTVSAPAGMVHACLDLLAVVQPVAPVDTEPESLPQLVRRTRCGRAIVVTGTPRPLTVDAVRRIRRAGISTLLIRVGSVQAAGLPGLQVIDVEHPGDLASTRA
jgi:uncharacterized protein (DUF58 family)